MPSGSGPTPHQVTLAGADVRADSEQDKALRAAWTDPRVSPEVWETLCETIGTTFNGTTIPALLLLLKMRLLKTPGCSTASTPSSPNVSASPIVSASPRLGDRKQTPTLRVLENASGVGASTILLAKLAQMDLLQVARPELCEITASDFAADALSILREHVQSRGLSDRVKFERWPMETIGAPTGHFTHVVTVVSAHWCTDEASMLQGVYRVLRPGGMAGFMNWEQIGWTTQSGGDMLRILPAAGWTDSDHIRRALQQRGFRDIDIEKVPFDTRFGEERLKAFLPILVEGAVSRMWNEENDRTDEETKNAMRDALVSEYTNGHIAGKTVILLTTCRKP